MIWAYLGELFRRVFFPTTRGADYISILVPLVAASTAYFLGITVSEDTTVQILAYVGLFTVAVFFIRLLFSGPYGMWRDEVTKVGELTIELSKPERAVLLHLSKHRAKARAKLASRLEDVQSLSYATEWTDACNTLFVKMSAKIWSLEAQAGLSESFLEGRRILLTLVEIEGRGKNAKAIKSRHSEVVLTLLKAYLMGNITAEALAFQLPKDIETEIQP